MQLYIISYPEYFRGEAALVTNLLTRYDVVYHLRKPETSCLDTEGFLNHIPIEHHSGIVLCSDYHLAERFKVKGLHFPTSRRAEVEFYPYDGTLSTSCHALDELNELDGQFNYMFLSPVFDSISKAGYGARFEKAELEKHLSLPRKSIVIALGGIDASNISEVRNLGFNGAAVLGTLWGNEPEKDANIEKSLKQLLIS